MGEGKMRYSHMFVAVLAAVGLMTALEVQRGHAGERHDNVPHETNGDSTLSAWKADLAWRDASMDSDADFELVLNSNGELSAKSVARLATMAPAAGPETIDPAQAVLALKRLAGDAVAILNDGQSNQTARVAKFRELMTRKFDIPLMARFTLGRHWKTASAEQKATYLKVFSKFLLNQYATKIAGAKVASFDVQSAQRAGRRDVMVQSRITQGNGQVLKLVWRMRQSNGQFRVIDVVAEGISLALTKRQEFAAIIKSNGGDVAQLIDRLRNTAA